MRQVGYDLLQDSDFFFENCIDSIDKLLHIWNPDVLMMFSPLYNKIKGNLDNWQQQERFFHAHFFTDSRHGDVIVLTKKNMKV